MESGDDTPQEDTSRGSGDVPREHPPDELYRAVFDVNTAIKLLIDPTTGRIVDANQAAVSFYGWPLDTLRSMRISDINMLSEEEVAAEMVAARTGKRSYFRFRHRTASGGLRHVEVHSGPVPIRDRKLLLSIIHDVTERDMFEHRLRIARGLEAVGRLAGSVAHEFNNLLTVMLNAATILQHQVPPEAPTRKLIDDIHDSAYRAAVLTRELLAFSRRQVMLPRDLDLNEVVSEMAGMLERALGDTFQIEICLAGDLPATRLDPRQLEHVVMNLVLNARDAMPAGGPVRVATGRRRVEADDGSDLPPGEWLCLSVRDQGKGMHAETLAQIFEPFFTTKPEGESTGLGLATVFGIVAQSGGHLHVDSQPGRGAEVLVLLPIVPVEAAGAANAQAPPAVVERPIEGAAVLLVEDTEAVRSALAAGLEQAGLAVVSAASAAAALAQIAERGAPFDAVVSDIVMPGGSGIDLAMELLQARPDLPVLLLSGDVRGHDLGRLPDHVAVLQKPVTAAQIAAALADLWGG